MGTRVRIVFFLVMAVLMVATLNSCTTAYSAARDERTLGDIVDDKKIAAKIKYALIRDDTIKGLDVSVYVYYGKCYLVGVVESGAQKSKAIQLARGVEGVKSVIPHLLNKKDVSMGKTIDDVGITAKVKAKMIGDKEMKATQVDVKTLYGHVVLLGIVGSAKDKNKAAAHARGIENVRSVKSYIIVK